VLCAGLIGAIACARGTEAHSATRTKLRVSTQPNLSQAVVLIAQAESLFAQEGLDVELVPIATSTQGVAPLLSGALDVLPSSPAAGLLNAMARGLAVRIVADRSFLDPDGCTPHAFAVPPGRVAATVAAPHRVKRVSVSRQHSTAYEGEMMLASVGLSVDSLTATEVPPLAEADALGKGTLDAALATEPWLTRELLAGKAEIWIRAERVLPNFETGLIFFGPNLLTRNRDAGRRFIVAYRRAIARYLEGKTPTNIALLARITHETPQVLKASCWISVHRDGRVNLAGLQLYQRWLQTKGLVPVLPTPAEMWDSSFVVYADSVLSARHE